MCRFRCNCEPVIRDTQRNIFRSKFSLIIITRFEKVFDYSKISSSCFLHVSNKLFYLFFSVKTIFYMERKQIGDYELYINYRAKRILK